MSEIQQYPIGVFSKKWGDEEKLKWRATQNIKRSYQQEVLSKLTKLNSRFDIFEYGYLPINPDRYPLMAVKTQNWSNNKPTVLITGGVHGYETSGVQGAIKFIESEAENYSQQFNLVIAPCVSPWGYEVINRWNPNTIDPNRSFISSNPSEEAAALMQLVASLNTDILLHIDLHETTDSDETEFRPALAARDGIKYEADVIPDGFYLVGDSENPQDEFQKTIIDAVRKVTHIAPPDQNGNIIGAPITQEGVINYPTKRLGLCAGMTNSQYCTTTEVYPDSPKANDDICNDAQVAAIKAALDFVGTNTK